MAIFLFFKTNLFQKYKELWVQTAMTTMNHQYLATWFLSDEEIAEIMKKLEVENNENSDSDNIVLKKSEKNAGIESAVEFGPFIIVNGNNQIKNSNSGGIHPRMAIGQKQDGTMLFVVIDGRQPGYSIGTNLLELQKIFEKYGAYNAANLDGGSSATMYYNGKVVNKTSTPMGERYLPNAFIVEE